jgi:hypothetical protein
MPTDRTSFPSSGAAAIHHALLTGKFKEERLLDNGYFDNLDKVSPIEPNGEVSEFDVYT